MVDDQSFFESHDSYASSSLGKWHCFVPMCTLIYCVTEWRDLYLRSPYHQVDTGGLDETKMLTTRGCHSCSSPESQELAKKSCVPCNSKDMHPISEDYAKKLLEQVNDWELTNEDGILKLHRAWKVKNFIKGLEFFQLVAAIAEEEGHHPDLHLVGWNNVKIDVWTHSVRGLTDNDFILAAKINHLNLEGILSKKASVPK